jgi:hypothetical protein
VIESAWAAHGGARASLAAFSSAGFSQPTWQQHSDRGRIQGTQINDCCCMGSAWQCMCQLVAASSSAGFSQSIWQQRSNRGAT